jgi:hypothetical protein
MASARSAVLELELATAGVGETEQILPHEDEGELVLVWQVPGQRHEYARGHYC